MSKLILEKRNGSSYTLRAEGEIYILEAMFGTPNDSIVIFTKPPNFFQKLLTMNSAFCVMEENLIWKVEHYINISNDNELTHKFWTITRDGLPQDLVNFLEIHLKFMVDFRPAILKYCANPLVQLDEIEKEHYYAPGRGGFIGNNTKQFYFLNHE